MSQTFNIYCDESCHLEHDHQKAMVLGGLWCPLDKAHEMAVQVRAIKVRHGLKPDFEIKWTKVSPAKKAFYLETMDYFFEDDDLHFRALVVPDKTKLRHEDHGQTHDLWYYKMYFQLLSVIIRPEDRYRIYLDVKDTRGAEKIRKLHEVLSNNLHDFSQKIVERIQLVESHQVELLQLADLLIGAVSYANRGLAGNTGKEALVERMRSQSHYALTGTTSLQENKVNLFCWEASVNPE
jgi:hypothetical protein